ncbi:MarR family winged helix-turn-helix transcriptional regulator [Paenirhodobacter enshiensis]|uniref:MarR family winged helix-turn-helix transcriptional regulator n=1 Tax=Paenirhodobacter enshiensis TaxID=1105367 RepID=UPI0035B3269E
MTTDDSPHSPPPDTDPDADLRPLEIAGHRIDILDGAFSWFIRSLDSVVSRDLDARMGHLEVAKGKGKITALLLIDDYPGIRPSEIAEVLMRDRPTTGRIIDRMVQAGLVSRGVSAHDQRAQSLTITPAGHDLAEKVRDIIRQQEAEFFDFIAPEDRAQFMRILRRTYMRMRSKWT